MALYCTELCLVLDCKGPFATGSLHVAAGFARHSVDKQRPATLCHSHKIIGRFGQRPDPSSSPHSNMHVVRAKNMPWQACQPAHLRVSQPPILENLQGEAGKHGTTPAHGAARKQGHIAMSPRLLPHQRLRSFQPTSHWTTPWFKVEP